MRAYFSQEHNSEHYISVFFSCSLCLQFLYKKCSFIAGICDKYMALKVRKYIYNICKQERLWFCLYIRSLIRVFYSIQRYSRRTRKHLIRLHEFVHWIVSALFVNDVITIFTIKLTDANDGCLLLYLTAVLCTEVPEDTFLHDSSTSSCIVRFLDFSE